MTARGSAWPSRSGRPCRRRDCSPIRHEARTDGKELSPLDGWPTLLMLLRCRRSRPATGADTVPSRA